MKRGRGLPPEPALCPAGLPASPLRRGRWGGLVGQSPNPPFLLRNPGAREQGGALSPKPGPEEAMTGERMNEQVNESLTTEEGNRDAERTIYARWQW